MFDSIHKSDFLTDFQKLCEKEENLTFFRKLVATETEETPLLGRVFSCSNCSKSKDNSACEYKMIVCENENFGSNDSINWFFEKEKKDPL